MSGRPRTSGILYDALDAYLLALGDDVTKTDRQHYYAYRRIKNFACVEIHPQTRKLLVYLKADPESITLESGFTRDMTKIGHFGTGDLEVVMGSRADFERAQPLISRAIRPANGLARDSPGNLRHHHPPLTTARLSGLAGWRRRDPERRTPSSARRGPGYAMVLIREVIELDRVFPGVRHCPDVVGLASTACAVFHYLEEVLSR